MTPLHFLLAFVFLGTGIFFQKSLKEFVPLLVASVMAKFEEILCERFGKVLKQSLRVIKTVNKHAIDIIS